MGHGKHERNVGGNFYLICHKLCQSGLEQDPTDVLVFDFIQSGVPVIAYNKLYLFTALHVIKTIVLQLKCTTFE